MNVKQLLLWLIQLYDIKEEQGDPEIKVRLVWRDANNQPCRVEYARFGFCSGLRPEVSVEMSTATQEGLSLNDQGINNDQQNARRQ